MSLLSANAPAVAAGAAGGKAAGLAAMAAAGLPVPPWFAVAPSEFSVSLSARQRAAFDAAQRTGQPFVPADDIAPTADFCHMLRSAIATLAPHGEPLAVRSSAGAEDQAGHSFAGQLASFLNVRGPDVPRRIVDVWRSAFAPTVVAYRARQGLPVPGDPPGVVIQRMVNAGAAGVAFSADPVSGARRTAVVVATTGLGDRLASGACSGATWRIDRAGHVIDFDAGAEVSSLPIDAATAAAIAALARHAADQFGAPQDIEWAIEDNRIQLLQSRPITALQRLGDPDGTEQLWDNSNIVESYRGVTTPLTFSFARAAYQQVYRRFCAVMGVSARAIAAHDDVFTNMIGLIRGRVYYNLLNWYRVLALLPGFRNNREFMEQMMGVCRSLAVSDAAVEAGHRDGWPVRTWRAVRGAVAMARWQLCLPTAISQFDTRVTRALIDPVPALSTLEPDELARYFRGLSCELLSAWEVPIVNDLFTMIFSGLLRRACRDWLHDPQAGTRLLACGDMPSITPATEMRGLAACIVNDSQIIAVLIDGDVKEIRAALAVRPQFAARYAQFMDAYADRCLDELKLETPTLLDDPLPLLRAVGQLALRAALPPNAAVQAAPEQAFSRRSLPLHRALIFEWLLRQSRRRIRDRERLRFARTRVFGRVRRIFVEFGRRFAARGLLANPADIFYLEVEEILGFVEGSATTIDLRGLAGLRRADFARFGAGPAPASRFVSRGVVNHCNDFGSAAAGSEPAAAVSGDHRQGLGCAAGRVRGKARIIADPRTQMPGQGDIVIAAQTDPGWILLLPLAAGLVVERGSVLSHSAIMARELGLPTVIGVTDACRWLNDDDDIEIDGSTGLVRLLNRAAEHADAAH